MLGANDTAVAAAVKRDRPHSDVSVETTLGDTSIAGDGKGGGPGVGPPILGETELIGATLSTRYQVTRKVGQGGMGAVYEATDTKINKRIAVKVLLEKYARREPIVQRLVQEARLASSCRNEHIIDFNDWGTTDDGRTFVVMEYLDGESLAELLARDHKLTEQRLLRIVSQAASALVAAHATGIVHRDIKPENLFLLRRNDQDFVKVVDFGISKSLRPGDEDEPRLTQTGMVLGTPLYMSPEQARGDDELDARVDVYALGVIMYEAATGRVPFTGNNYLSVISQVLNEEPRRPRELRPDLSDELEAVILRAMAKDRDERYASASALLADVTALLEDPTRSTERARITGPRKKSSTIAPAGRSPLRIAIWIALVAVVVAAVVITVVLLLSGDRIVIQPRHDAGVVKSVVDAFVPPPPPEAETIEVTIKTIPTGADIQIDGVDKGPAPVTTRMVVHDHPTDCVASLPGYDDRPFQINPFVKDKTYNIKLKKTPEPQAPQAPEPDGKSPGKSDKPGKPGNGSGKAATPPKPSDRTGGDFQGNPFPADSPNKKP